MILWYLINPLKLIVHLLHLLLSFHLYVNHGSGFKARTFQNLDFPKTSISQNIILQLKNIPAMQLYDECTIDAG